MPLTSISYSQIKQAMQERGLPVSPGSAWAGTDSSLYTGYAAGACYAGGVPFKKNPAFYGIAYPGAMPQAISDAVIEEDYSVTIAGTPTGGKAPFTVNFTATQVGGTATNYAWDFGDGSAIVNTTVPTTSHSYVTAGTVTPKMTPTFNGVVMPQVLGAVITVLNYSATLAGTPLTGVHPTPVTWTATESNVPAGATKSYLWDFGDGSNTTTAVPTAQHTYAAAGTFTAKVTPTINGIAIPQVTAAAPAVLT